MEVLYSGVAVQAALRRGAKADAEDANGQARFAAQQVLAERLLGFRAPALTDPEDVAIAELAIALQLNYQYELGVDAFVYSDLSSQPQAENRTFRDDLPLVTPQAQALADQVLESGDEADRWATVRSVRGPCR